MALDPVSHKLFLPSEQVKPGAEASRSRGCCPNSRRELFT